MFYHLFSPLADTPIFGYTIFNVFQYVTFRAIAAFITALLFSLLLGPKFIKILQGHHAIERINDYLPISHREKEGTPSMGGLIVISSLLLSVLLWNNLVNSYILIMIITTVWLGGIGFLDDYMKNFLKMKQGLIAKYKLLAQITLGILVSSALYFGSPDKATIAQISIPFVKSTFLYLGIIFIPFGVFMVTATSNAVNLTDGLDGLASGTVALAAFGLGIMAYLKGNFNLAHYFNLEFISNAGELTVFISALIGTLMGFLWYNIKPAQIFLGDTGSLALGGILAVLSMLLREEIFFAIVGGIFVIETLSSIIQRYYFKYTRIKFGKGRRVFKCAPIHHHFEMKGISEEKIVIRFWIVGMLLVAIGLATLKLR
ncbi:MAG: phospho-N-acetylmuramoyl-pentapeptide-transferase [Candidatus Cloacimonetes bacterium]|nr:phospho-N-acetylmuramoyl-pentapeptide-transferase [Candidatus Cloacimonadota bacterium]MCF7814120.1 phospho-N-acetylmuramoyl-pentapeptide-transferase [Candidatus Cloacimonadota bacterium]MCF7868731.1 phospho-N-acetylmuramoyl-pentapeptide-transferase [Candidatus Cloacimonadota bacterium]MCF7884119.1 phospho-N-acetylmuramoyl-pentapeptide-transferase [Candidatus Cloacimonadota bacterium]